MPLLPAPLGIPGERHGILIIIHIIVIKFRNMCIDLLGLLIYNLMGI